MNSPEQTPESRPARERRVGTFTFGAVLVICGVLMLVSKIGRASCRERV